MREKVFKFLFPKEYSRSVFLEKKVDYLLKSDKVVIIKANKSNTVSIKGLDKLKGALFVSGDFIRIENCSISLKSEHALTLIGNHSFISYNRFTTTNK